MRQVKRWISGLLAVLLVAGLTPARRARAYSTGKVGERQTISAGFNRSLAIKEDGTLWAWGVNHGVLGDGTTEERHTPVKVMDNVAAVSAGYVHVLAVKTDGTLWAWGDNSCGQLGDGTTEERHTPVKVMDDVVAASAGAYCSFAIKMDGTLLAWGDNLNGRLGTGESSHTPVKVMDNVAVVSAGFYHTVAVKTDGTLWAWGGNQAGQLGDGTPDWQHQTPAKIMDDVVAVNAGFAHTFAIKTDGTLWAWGANYAGQLGDGTTEERHTPVKVMDDVVAVSTGNEEESGRTYAVKSDGTLWLWGATWGEFLGGIPEVRLTPMMLVRNVVAVSTGWNNTLAIDMAGTLWGWGDNGPGQLQDQDNPIEIMGNVKLPGSFTITEPLPPQDTPSADNAPTEDGNNTPAEPTEVKKPATKAEEIKLKRVLDNARVVEDGVDYGVTDCEYAVITGVDSGGDEVWRYTTDKYVATECYRTGEIGINRGMYLFCDGGTITALDVQTGAVRWQNSDYGGAHGSYLMDNDVLYVCGQYGPDFYAIDMAGNTLARVETLDDEYYWAERIKHMDNNVVAVEFMESEGSYRDTYCVYIDCRDYTFSRTLANLTQEPQDAPATDKTDPQPDSGTDSSNASSLLSDFDQVRHKEAVTALVEQGIIKGLPDGRYAPRDHIDRSSWAKLLAEPLNPYFSDYDWAYYLDAYTGLKDIEHNWAESYIKYLYFRDIICGDNLGNYRPTDDITIVEAAKTILVAIGLDADAQGYTNNALWAENIMDDARKNGLMTGLNVYAFDSLTRDDAAQMIHNALDELGI